MLLAVLGYLAVQQACGMIATGAKAVSEGAADVAARFRTGTITTTFIASLPHLVSGGTKLELTAVQATETFTRSDDRRVLFELLPLGTTTSEIRVPVTYRYHVRLDEPWRLTVHDHRCLVRAPPIRPTLPPAIDTAGLEKHSESGWLRFDADERMADLERSLTELLSRRAADPDTIDLVRETCRRRLAEFVRGWLLSEGQWGGDRFRTITVVFADEKVTRPSTLPPTLFEEAD